LQNLLKLAERTFLSKADGGTRGGVRKRKWVNADLRARKRESICESIFASPSRAVPFREKLLTSCLAVSRRVVGKVLRRQCADRQARQSAYEQKIERTKKSRSPRVAYTSATNDDDGRQQSQSCPRKFDILMPISTNVN